MTKDDARPKLKGARPKSKRSRSRSKGDPPKLNEAWMEWNDERLKSRIIRPRSVRCEKNLSRNGWKLNKKTQMILVQEWADCGLLNTYKRYAKYSRKHRRMMPEKLWHRRSKVDEHCGHWRCASDRVFRASNQWLTKLPFEMCELINPETPWLKVTQCD